MARKHSKGGKARSQSGRRNEGPLSSQGPMAPTRAAPTRAIGEACEVGHHFQTLCYESAKKEVEDVEVVVRAQCLATSYEEILEEVKDQVSDPTRCTEGQGI
jgi:hypothetical protein